MMMWMYFATSEVVELSLMFTNLAFREFSVSMTYTASHSSYLILYTCSTMFSLLSESFGFTNNCLSVIVGLKYVALLHLLNICLSFSKNLFVYGITTRIFFDLSLSDVSILSPNVSTASSS